MFVRFLVELHSAYQHDRRSVVVEAPNMDCAFWVAVYETDPEDKKGYWEHSVTRLPSDKKG